MLNQETIQKLLAYNPRTGIFTRRVRTANAIRAGDVAGSINSVGYSVISVQNKRWLAHRLAWLYIYGAWPSGNIDHIDGNKLNNAIKNLRECTPSQNVANTKLGLRNSSGFKGVSKAIKHENAPWRARITVNYHERTIGYYRTREEAHAAYCKAAKESFGEFHKTK